VSATARFSPYPLIPMSMITPLLGSLQYLWRPSLRVAAHVPLRRAAHRPLRRAAHLPLRRAAHLPLLAATALLTACAGVRGTGVTSIAPVTAQRVVASATGKTVPFAEMVTAASEADVVFFGEQHDDAETHRAELALLTGIGERRQKVVLSLEMFERDVQPLIDAYLAGGISEADFRAQSRPWPNYESDYRPLLELAKAKRWPVIAANVPRRLASMVSRRGLAGVDSLSIDERRLVAVELQCPQDQYYRNFLEAMGGGHGAPASPHSESSANDGMMDRFYQAQCVKDETMAESIVAGRNAAGGDAIVVHFNGAFHSDYGLGTADRVRRRVAGVKTVVVSAVPVPDVVGVDAGEFLDRGGFVVLVRRVEGGR